MSCAKSQNNVQKPAHLLAVLELPDEKSSIGKLKTMLELLDKLYTSVMKKGVDYDTLPGTPKPGLLKPGAELLIRFFNLVPDTRIVRRIEKTELETPYFQYDTECRLCNRYEVFVGNGIGSCNSAEPSYAFRWVFQGELPEELVEKKNELRKTVLPNGQAQFRIRSSRNETFGAVNSIQKRAKKRALMDAVLGVTGAGRLFTADLNEEQDESDTDSGTGRSS